MKKLIRALNLAEEWTLVLVLLGLACLTFVQVCSRYLLNYSFTWMEELSRYLGVFIAFLGASLGVKYGAHFSMDLVYERVQNDRIRHALKIFVNAFCGVLFIVIAYYGLIQTLKLQHFGVSTSALQLPKYWAYAPIPFFSIFIALRFFILMAGHARDFRHNNPYAPVGQK